MAGTHKKVVVRLFGAAPVAGYLPPSGFVAGGRVAIMDPGGRLVDFALNEIQWIAYVRDFNSDDTVDPERLGRMAFLARPRAEGLWVRLRFANGTRLEGLASPGLALADGLIEDAGVFFAPPDPRSNAHRMYVPRVALDELEILGVIASAARRKPAPKEGAVAQPGLFGEE